MSTLAIECRNTAYHGQDRSQARQRVFECIEANQPISAGRIGDLLGCTPNQVSGRVTELRQAGRIEECGTEVSKYGKTVCRWRIAADVNGQARLF